MCIRDSNTIIVIWGDHGYKLGDHNSWGKMTNYNIDLKVPIIIRTPDQQNQGVKTEAITELVDLFPTVCELAGVAVPSYMQGTSMVPLMEDPQRDWKSAAFSQFHRRPKVSADGKRYMGYSINTYNHHYVEWYTWNHKKGLRGKKVDVELYDRSADPHEFVNIAAQEDMKGIVAQLSLQLEQGWQDAKP